MAVINFNPARGFESMSRRVNEFMSEIEKGMNLEIGGFAPRVDIIEEENKLRILAEVPGVAKENIKISVNEDRVLTLVGEKKRTDLPDEKSYIRTERTFGEFKRSFVLAENLDVENINAKFENGVLEITFSKAEPPKPKEIHINID